jgi:hypothetical protein
MDYVFAQAAGRGMGAYMAVEMPEDNEIRRAIPAITGRKRITYDVNLHCYHLAHMKHAEDAEADVNGLIEAIKAAIHADVTLGAICYQAGENGAGIRTRITPSVTDDEIVATYILITLQAEVEIVA